MYRTNIKGGKNNSRQVTSGRTKEVPSAKRQKRDDASSITGSSKSKDSARSSSTYDFEVLDLHRESVKRICMALNSGDPEDHEKAFTEYCTEKMLFYGKWMNEDNLPTDALMKEIIIRDRKTFLSFWESRMTAIPDLAIKYHFPIKYQQREDGGITAYINMFISGTKVCESKGILFSETLDLNVVSVTMEDKARAQPHPHDMMALKVNMDAKANLMTAAADAVVALHTGNNSAASSSYSLSGEEARARDAAKNNSVLIKDGSDNGLAAINTFPSTASSNNRSTVFDDTYRIAKTMKADSYGTLSFHFDKTTNKLFEIDMLRSVVAK